MFKTGVEQMITILDEIATESDIGKMYMDACGLSLEATTTDISGKSEALETDIDFGYMQYILNIKFLDRTGQRAE